MRDDKQVELRIKELANMKMKYVELKNNTEPIINSLSTKVNVLCCFVHCIFHFTLLSYIVLFCSLLSSCILNMNYFLMQIISMILIVLSTKITIIIIIVIIDIILIFF